MMDTEFHIKCNEDNIEIEYWIENTATKEKICMIKQQAKETIQKYAKKNNIVLEHSGNPLWCNEKEYGYKTIKHISRFITKKSLHLNTCKCLYIK